MYNEVSNNRISIFENHCTIFMNTVNLHWDQEDQTI